MSDDLTTRAWPAVAGHELPPPPNLPDFELLDELGRGGMGVVYKARQTSTGRLVAIKLIRDLVLADSEERARFRIEREVTSRLRHPNIVQILASGEHEGRPYFAMELIEGGSLAQYVKRQQQPVGAVADFARKLALAVAHAHEQSIVHRDLKPANILLSPATTLTDSAEACSLENWEPRISDFGLAKRLDSTSMPWTQAGAVIGTAAYMSPEQATGQVELIGPATDIYALGAILYELLTGQPPFPTNSWRQLIENVQRAEPVPPSRIRSEIPMELGTICLKCLEKQPERRYPSAAELADDLARFLAGSPIAAAPIDDEERLARAAARDGFEILELIGRGPHGMVYRATQATLQQPVAVKVFHAGAIERGVWEARLAENANIRGALTHPQVLIAHQAGWWGDSAYLAMDYVPQGSLAGKQFKLRESLELLIKLAEVVGYLHRQGAVHGNLKPSNVLLAPGGLPRVSDLHFTSGSSSMPLLSAGDSPTGIEYLAPELLADPRPTPLLSADIYGLGVILYELLTRRPPFAAATPDELQSQIRDDEPPPPSQFNPQVPGALDYICQRSLRKNPWSRFSRAFDVSRRLEAILDQLS